MSGGGGGRGCVSLQGRAADHRRPSQLSPTGRSWQGRGGKEKLPSQGGGQAQPSHDRPAGNADQGGQMPWLPSSHICPRTWKAMRKEPSAQAAFSQKAPREILLPVPASLPGNPC